MLSTLTARQEAAAVLVAADEETDVAIAAAVGIHKATLETWKKKPEFAARVRQIIEQLAEDLQRYHIARKDKRIKAMDKRWRALHQVIEERAAAYQQIQPRTPRTKGGFDADDELISNESGEVPAQARAALAGTTTGHIVLTFIGGMPAYAVDTGLLAELRALEKQAAQESGQWKDKVEHSGELDVTLWERLARAIHDDKRAARGDSPPGP